VCTASVNKPKHVRFLSKVDQALMKLAYQDPELPNINHPHIPKNERSFPNPDAKPFKSILSLNEFHKHSPQVERFEHLKKETLAVGDNRKIRRNVAN
jgi:hypothetical protein